MKLTTLLLFVSLFAFGQTRDSLVYTKVTVQVSHDTTFTQVVTQNITHDSTYTKVDTIKIPVDVTLKGMYLHPDIVTIGNATSENSYLAWCKREGVNMLNCYARAYTYTETKRGQLAAFTKKAKEQYGIIEVSIDVRLTDNRELPGIIAYFQKYAGTISMINLLAEFEPYIIHSGGQYDNKYLPTYQSKYLHMFYMLRTLAPLCKQYGTSFDWYEGWIGNEYGNNTTVKNNSFSQVPVDSLMKYISRMFTSNYVVVTQYNSTSVGLGKFDNRMDKRMARYSIGCINVGRDFIMVVEIISVESIYLYSVFDCPSPEEINCPFYGITYTQGLASYNSFSTTTETAYKILHDNGTVKQRTRLIGRTIFLDKYAKQSHP